MSTTTKTVCTTTGQHIAYAIFLAVLRTFVGTGSKLTPVPFSTALWMAYVEAIRVEARYSVQRLRGAERRAYLEQMVAFVQIVQRYYGRELNEQTVMEIEAYLPTGHVCVWDSRLERCHCCHLRPAFSIWRGMFICSECRYAVEDGIIDAKTIRHMCVDCRFTPALFGRKRCETCDASLKMEIEFALDALRKRRRKEDQVLLMLLIEDRQPWWMFSPALVNIFNQGVYSVIDRVRRFGEMTHDLCAGLLEHLLDDRRLFPSAVSLNQLKGVFFGRRHTDTRRGVPVGG